MKKQVKRILALLLAVLLLACQTVYASEALGSELLERRTTLTSGLTLTQGSLWSATYSDLRTEHYLTYEPGTGATPVVFSGQYTASTDTIASAAAQMEAQGWRVVAGINGGFFNTDGTAVGMLLTEGVLRAADKKNYAMVGITADGHVFVDESELTKTAQWRGRYGETCTAEIIGFNAYRTEAGLYLYNGGFASKVQSSAPCVYAILQPVGAADLTMNGSLMMQVVAVTDTTVEGVPFDGVIPEGSYMLYAEETAEAELLSQLRALRAGSQVTVSVTGASSRWSEAVYGVSGVDMLVRDGQVVPEWKQDAAPRTAIGIRPDGSVIFYTIDGRQAGYSIGANYVQVAQRLIELGCTTAVALDGGGSTTLGATLPGSEGFSVVNNPSGNLRRINNCILFLMSGDAAGLPEGAYVTAEQQVVLAGSSLAVSGAPYDTVGYPAFDTDLTWSAEGGSIVGEGTSAVYTAGAVPGVYNIYAGGTEGLLVRVVDQLTELVVTREGESLPVTELLLLPGEQVELTANPLWYNLSVAVDPAAISWTVEGTAGVMDENGCFTAVNDNGTGTLTVSAGELTLTIPIKVDRGDPFTDMGGHWATSYVTRLYKLGITSGIPQPDGSWVFNPNSQLTRGELLVFLTRMLGVDTARYELVELPFADVDAIPEWTLPSVKAMYALGVFQGGNNGGVLTANVGDKVTREAAMTMMGRVLLTTEECDLSLFTDGDAVSGWASVYVQTLVARGVVAGSEGLLRPQNNMDRASAAKLLVMIYEMEKAPLEPNFEPEQSDWTQGE